MLNASWKRLEDVLKTYSQDKYIGLDQDVLKTSSEDEDERRLQDVFIKTNVCWVVSFFHLESKINGFQKESVLWKNMNKQFIDGYNTKKIVYAKNLSFKIYFRHWIYLRILRMFCGWKEDLLFQHYITIRNTLWYYVVPKAYLQNCWLPARIKGNHIN